MTDRVARIEQRLREALAPESIEIGDESHLHAGHEGAKGGGGHFAVTIVSAKFQGQNTVMRHRLVYDALGNMMQKEIHALSITALSPDEL